MVVGGEGCVYRENGGLRARVVFVGRGAAKAGAKRTAKIENARCLAGTEFAQHDGSHRACRGSASLGGGRRH